MGSESQSNLKIQCGRKLDKKRMGEIEEEGNRGSEMKKKIENIKVT